MQTRKELIQLIEDSKGDAFEVVLVFTISALPRNDTDLLMIVETLQGNNKRVFAVDKEVYLI